MLIEWFGIPHEDLKSDENQNQMLSFHLDLKISKFQKQIFLFSFDL